MNTKYDIIATKEIENPTLELTKQLMDTDVLP